MRIGSLCSGCGLLDSGLSQAGHEIEWACEIERNARAVLRRHHPGTMIFHDVKRMWRHARNLPAVDAVFAGFPCQDLSVAGARAGLAGARSGLFFRIMHLVSKLRPRPAFLGFENVPGLLSSAGGRDMGVIIRTLEQCGYFCAWRVLDLQFFGVPQRRRRVFLVGHLGDWRRAAEILFERESVCGNPPARRKQGQEVAGSLGGGAGKRGWCNDLDRSGAFVPDPENTMTGSSRRRDGGDGGDVIVASSHAECFDASEHGMGRGTPLAPVGPLSCGDRGISVDQACAGLIQPVALSLRGREGGGTAELSGEVSPSIRASQGGGDKQHVLAPVAFQDRFRGDDGRGYNRPPPALAGMTGALETVKPWHVATPMSVRRLTPVECERLMDAEDGYTA
ncbi:MAG: DNA cytosine methyltransferase [Desulfovibrio sp.]|nr:DNA cytosine methyltransferase [Desulfovibrio sp.]